MATRHRLIERVGADKGRLTWQDWVREWKQNQEEDRPKEKIWDYELPSKSRKPRPWKTPELPPEAMKVIERWRPEPREVEELSRVEPDKPNVVKRKRAIILQQTATRRNG